MASPLGFADFRQTNSFTALDDTRITSFSLAKARFQNGITKLAVPEIRQRSTDRALVQSSKHKRDSSGIKQRVRVVARFRPFNDVESNLNNLYPPNTVQNLVRFQDNNVVNIIESAVLPSTQRGHSVESNRTNEGVMRHTFKFDKVFGPEKA